MIIEGVIGCSVQGSGDCAAKEEGKDFVASVVGLVFIKCEADEGVVHEISVVEERSKEGAGPACCEGNVGIVAIIRHVGCDEGPLGEANSPNQQLLQRVEIMCSRLASAPMQGFGADFGS